MEEDVFRTAFPFYLLLSLSIKVPDRLSVAAFGVSLTAGVDLLSSQGHVTGVLSRDTLQTHCRDIVEV